MLAPTQVPEKLTRILRITFQGSAGWQDREFSAEDWHWKITKYQVNSNLEDIRRKILSSNENFLNLFH